MSSDSWPHRTGNADMTNTDTTPKQLTMFDAKSLLEASDDKILVSSLDVAYHFDKQHKNVLRDIEALECSSDFRRLNFEPSSYYNSQNKTMPMFKLTRDGFAMLVMGFICRVERRCTACIACSK
jgi:Rha family phage regulatory protein